jgi:DNA-binding CsgD family transcriptional regulator
VESGSGGALLVRGEAGMGKTALLDHVAATADGAAVLRVRGVEAEHALAYAALHQLLRPVLSLAADLPEPQRDALEHALAISPGQAADRLAIGAATLGLLTATAAELPVVCLVDDANWLDAESAEALVFAARRLGPERVAVLFGVRPALPEFAPPGVEVLELERLGAEDARELLAREAGTEVSPAVATRLAEAAAGNPLALAHLASALTAGQLAGRDALPHPLPTADVLARAFLAQVLQLSTGARESLLRAAAADTQALLVIQRSAADDSAGGQLDEAERAGLVSIRDGRFQFSHPLVRSAIYQAASADDRRAAHRLLAEALEEPRYRDRRALHLAEAATGPDEHVASELEWAAARFAERSGYEAELVVLERAADLSAHEAAGRRRRIASAEAAWRAGSPARALRALERVGEPDGDPVAAARIARLRALAELRDGDPQMPCAQLEAAAGSIAAEDPELAAELLIEAADASGGDHAVTLAARARELAPEGGEAELRACVALARVLRDAGRDAEAADPSERAAAILEANPQAAHDPDVLLAVAVSASDPAVAAHLVGRAVATARRRGALMVLPAALLASAGHARNAGRWTDAEALLGEAARLAVDTGQGRLERRIDDAWARLAASLGRREECERLAAGLEPADRAAVLGLLELAVGDASAAVERLEPALLDANPGAEVLADLAEARARAGDIAGSQALLGRIAGGIAAGPAEVLVAPAEELDQRFSDAVATVDDPFRRARLLVAYGIRLRREGRRVECREPLQEAARRFDALGASPWAEQARRELRASGERVRRRGDASIVDDLTAQELEVATMIAGGDSYQQAAAKLVVSPRTVDYHLQKVYRKLGCTRRDLAERLRALDPPA